MFSLYGALESNLVSCLYIEACLVFKRARVSVEVMFKVALSESVICCVLFILRR